MIDNCSRVKLVTDKYLSEGARAEDIGYVIEVYPDGAYEVEFSDEGGASYAQIVAREDELQREETSQTLQRSNRK